MKGKEMQERLVICPVCGYKEAIRKGSRTHVSGKTVERYMCKRCGHKFTPKQMKASFTRGSRKYQTGKTSIERDKSREAQKPGKRIVKHYDKNGKFLGITIYWEYRRNRSDVDPRKRL